MVDAGRAAAATYASVSEIPVIGWILAPIAAAAAFAAVAAYSAFGGKSGGGDGGGYGGYAPTPSGGAFHQGGVLMHGGGQVPVYAHAGLNLADDERHIVARVGEGVLQVPAMNKWARAGVGFDLLNDPERLPEGNFMVPPPGFARGRSGAPSGPPQVQEHRLTLVLQTPDGVNLGTKELRLIAEDTQKRLNHGKLTVPARPGGRH